MATVVGLLEVDLLVPDCRSLKEKRMVLKSMKDRLHNHFNISVSEVDHQDVWQRVKLAISMAGSDQRTVNSSLDSVVDFLEKNHSTQMVDYQLSFL